jgi:SnoaL-like domain
MIINAISRRSLLKTGAYTLAGTSGLLWAARALAREDGGSALAGSAFHMSQSGNAGDRAEEGSNMAKERTIRQYYSGWEKKEWSAIDSVLADSFSFTSPNDDDHIDKGAFKARCWGQADYIERFELETVVVRDNEAFVKYLCRTTKGTSFRNIEYFRFAGGKISAVECYFGGRLGYPTASISGKP